MQSFFNYQGFAPSMSHAGSYIPDVALIIPKRHPHDVYQSHVGKENFDMAMLIGWWHELIFRATNGDSFVFPIKKKDEKIEKGACEFVGVKWSAGFPWVTIGASQRNRDSATNIVVQRQLQFAVDWFNGD